jgi:hypothetical protein
MRVCGGLNNKAAAGSAAAIFLSGPTIFKFQALGIDQIGIIRTDFMLGFPWQFQTFLRIVWIRFFRMSALDVFLRMVWVGFFRMSGSVVFLRIVLDQVFQDDQDRRSFSG